MAAIASPRDSRGGYDYQFVKTPADTLICTVCFLPSREPCLSECCGHTFCKSCLESSKKFSNICPVCRSKNFITIFNKQADRVIRSLHVFCTNKEQGCEWEGEVNDITNHLGNCIFQIVHCPNDCGESLRRQDLTIHFETECPHRRVSCQYCNDVGEYQLIEGQHKEECHKFPIQCPNACKIENICRDEVKEHREVCPLEIIQCDYHVVGCKVKMARKDINTHKQETMEAHLSLSINELMETRKQLKSTQRNLKHEVEKNKEALTQRIALVENHLSSANKQLKVLSTTSQQEAKRTKERLFQKLAATEKELNTTKQQLATTCQNVTKAKKEHTASTDKALTEMETKFEAKITAAENRIAELERKLQQETQPKEEGPWLTSLHNRASRLASDDHVVPVVVKMTEFTKHKGTNWLSKPFYSNHSKECKLQLQVAAAPLLGYTYMSVSLVVDNKQSKQQSGKSVVKLLNQISDSHHHVGGDNIYQFTISNVIWQNQCFITYENLHKITDTCRYLKDDTLFFEVLKS